MGLLKLVLAVSQQIMSAIIFVYEFSSGIWCRALLDFMNFIAWCFLKRPLYIHIPSSYIGSVKLKAPLIWFLVRSGHVALQTFHEITNSWYNLLSTANLSFRWQSRKIFDSFLIFTGFSIEVLRFDQQYTPYFSIVKDLVERIFHCPANVKTVLVVQSHFLWEKTSSFTFIGLSNISIHFHT